MSVSLQTYERVALEDPEGRWELHQGRLREKPSMSAAHNDVAFFLGHLFQLQLDRHEYRIKVNSTRVRRTDENYYIPDVVVIPVSLSRPILSHPNILEIYDQPLPFVAEVWSPSPGGYDQDAKLPEYQRRGDREIWRLHPFERTAIAWRRQPDGTYAETIYHGGIIRVESLPDVTIDLDALFNLD